MKPSANRMKDYYFRAIWLGFIILVLLGKAPSLYFFLSDVDFGIRFGLARQVMLGKTPFIDLWYLGGPLWAYAPALGLWVDDSLIPETLICSVGYGISLFLISLLVEANLPFGRVLNRVLGVAAGLAGLAFLSRFEKWYYWLCPLLVLFCFLQIATSPNANAAHRKWIAFAGLASGLGFLFRFDLGIGCLFAAMTTVALYSIRPFSTETRLGRAVLVIIGFVTLVIPWLLFLGLKGGISVWRDLAVGFYQGIPGQVVAMHEPYPAFDVRHLSGHPSGLAIFLVVVPATYLLGITYGLLGVLKQRGENQATLRFLLAACIMGLAMWPEAIQRTAVASFLSVLPPFVLTGTILCGQLWGPVGRFRGSSLERYAVRGGVVLYLMVLAVAGRAIRAEAAFALEPFGHKIVERFNLLAGGIPEGMDHPTAKLVEGVHHRTGEGDTVLYLIPYSAAHSFIHRPISGNLDTHLTGHYSEQEWRERNLRLIRLHPPALVIAERGYENLRTDRGFRKGFPELDAYVRENYRVDRPFTEDIVFWTVLVPRANTEDAQ
ncbi:MAG: hypothetical protein AAB353_02840 [Candidatus Hydrogenedentota bacterium]